MRNRRGYPVLLAIVLVIALASVVTIAAAKPHAKAAKTQVYMAKLMPLNDSGVAGTAILKVKKGKLYVKVIAKGLKPGETHMQHIHGFESGQVSVCPTMGADTNADGIVSLPEGLPAYGPVLLPLTDYPMANAVGKYRYRKTFSSFPGVQPANIRTLVVHGMDVNGTYDPTVPVACAQIKKLTKKH